MEGKENKVRKSSKGLPLRLKDFLHSSPSLLQGISTERAKRLAQFNIHTCYDLLFHLPYGYEDWSFLQPVDQVGELDLDSIGQEAYKEERVVSPKEVCICGQVLARPKLSYGRKSFMRLSCQQVFPEEGQGTQFEVLFFNPRYLQSIFTVGSTFLFKCTLNDKHSGRSRTFVHPRFQKIEQLEDVRNLTSPKPVYPLKRGLNQAFFRQAQKQLFQYLLSYIEKNREEAQAFELFSPTLRKKYQLPSRLLSFAVLHEQAIEHPLLIKEWKYYVQKEEETEDKERLATKRGQEVGEEVFLRRQRQSLRKLARKRLAFEELFFFKYALVAGEREEQAPARYCYVPRKDRESVLQYFLQNLPFKLTQGQKEACLSLYQDMQGPKAMQRLIQGDVGSGKTIVAFYATLLALLTGGQVLFMAPTSALAQQIFAQYQRFFSPLTKANITLAQLVEEKEEEKHLALQGRKETHTGEKKGKEVAEKDKRDTSSWEAKGALLLGSTRAKEAREIRQAFSEGRLAVLVGTTSLLNEDIDTRSVSLVITDEQHRFGVKQRLKLASRSKAEEIPEIQTFARAHVLSMSATPIPRSLALVLYGNMAVSQIYDKPQGRPNILTYRLKSEDIDRAFDILVRELHKGSLFYVVCPRKGETEEDEALYLVEGKDSQEGKEEKMPLIDVYQALEILEKDPRFQCFSKAVLHGSMKPKEKEKILQDFYAGKIAILVSTSVIEVGIDQPKANLMLVFQAERFGLAQLHQLRGRIGRNHQANLGDKKVLCLLHSDSQNPLAIARLKALCKSTDGFALANQDLQLRGPGNFFGTEQHGLPLLRIANLYEDMHLLKQADEALLHEPEQKRIWEEDMHLRFGNFYEHKTL